MSVTGHPHGSQVNAKLSLYIKRGGTLGVSLHLLAVPEQVDAQGQLFEGGPRAWVIVPTFLHDLMDLQWTLKRLRQPAARPEEFYEMVDDQLSLLVISHHAHKHGRRAEVLVTVGEEFIQDNSKAPDV